MNRQLDEEKFDDLVAKVKELGKMKDFLDMIGVVISEKNFNDYMELFVYP